MISCDLAVALATHMINCEIGALRRARLLLQSYVDRVGIM